MKMKIKTKMSSWRMSFKKKKMNFTKKMKKWLMMRNNNMKKIQKINLFDNKDFSQVLISRQKIENLKRNNNQDK